MSAIDSIISYFKKKDTTEAQKSPEGFCPNCWGKQEYEGKIIDIVKDQSIDIKNMSDKRAFIQDFVVAHIDGIRLRERESQLICPACDKLNP